MCGIAGIVSFTGRASPDAIGAMVSALAHRGPDDDGVWVRDGVAIGMRRLAVLDLSPLGHQPMQNEDGSVQLVFNGEIYNYQDLRSRLVAEGHAFRSQSDTEVLIHGYEQFGIRGLLERLNGMFAFALLDLPRGQLFLARDRFGVKPLYLRRGDGQFSFASEVRALGKDGTGMPGIDPSFVGSYLRTGYVPSPHCAFRGVRRLAPGTVVTLDVRAGEEREERYYELLPMPEAQLPDDPRELRELFSSTLDLAIRRQLVSDAPLGVFLSSGLDSGAVSLSASRRRRGRLSTFSIGFEGSDRGDELDGAHELAHRLGTEEHVERIGPASLTDLPRIVESLEEPIGDSAVVPLWSLCRLSRRGVTVALSGEGGDEAFGGYGRYYWTALTERHPRSLELSTSVLRSLGSSMPLRTHGPLNFVRRAVKLSETLRLPDAERYLAWFDLFTPDERRALHPSSSEQVEARVHQLFERGRQLGLDSVQRMQFVDIQTFLLDNLLVKSDRLSMAHSLEVRVPLIDHRLLELGLSLPRWAKVSRKQTKVLMRAALARDLGRTARRPKRGFELPIDAWLRSPEARPAVEGLSSGALVRRLGFQARGIDAILEAHRGGQDVGRKIFALVVLESWADRYS